MKTLPLWAGIVGIGAILSAGAAPLWGQQESEPNNTPATADTVQRGSSVQAMIGPFDQTTSEPDQDYWVLFANKGDAIFVDIDADEFGTKTDMYLALYAGDGTTRLTFNDDWDGLDPHLEYVAQTTGAYYVRAGTSLETSPWVAVPYTLHFFRVTCPTTLDPEPNNTPATAMRAAVGQAIHGRTCPTTDVDFYKFDLDPGTVEFTLETDPHERPSFGNAWEIEGWIELYGPDGTTKLASTHFSGEQERIEYTVTTRGTYFLLASMYPGGFRYTYSVSSRVMSGPAPGDPITVRADLPEPNWSDNGAVVDRNGDMLVSHVWAKIWRISPQGGKSLVTTQVAHPAGLAWDEQGNLLIVNASETDGGVFKLSPSGQLTRFITDKRATGAIAMARDGSVWLGADWPTMALLHYDAQGKLIAAHDLSSISAGGGPHHVALGPSGDPYFSNYQNLYRFRAGSAERLIHYESTDSHPTEIGSFAFDVQGNIYIPNRPAGVVNLHDGTGKWLATIAYQPNAPSRVFFGRNADGSTNARLFAIDGNQLIELDPAGARARGLPVQFEPQQVQEEATVADAVTDLLKGGVLTAAQRTDLDQRGNKNGRYDVGDLRALLIRSGILTTPTGAH